MLTATDSEYTRRCHCKVVNVKVEDLDVFFVECVLEYVKLLESIGKEVCQVQHHYHEIVGSRLGMVMCQMIFILEAPSTFAAVISSSSIPAMAAIYMIAAQPAFFHVSHSHILNHM